MYYHIRRINPLGMNVYYKDDNTWTEDYNQRKVFPTLFQVEQFKKTEVVDKWGNKRVPHAIKTSIVEDSDTLPVSELGAPVGTVPTNSNNNYENGRDGIISQVELDKL
tara:strand:+ start:579 stop:902 length:324 start_codon:yes stop_codon:yes gene_type:complete